MPVPAAGHDKSQDGKLNVLRISRHNGQSSKCSKGKEQDKVPEK
jgi:hypothetical protein